MRLTLLIAAALAAPALATPTQADVLQGRSADPLGELTTLYSKICNWDGDQTIPSEAANLNDDGVDDLLVTYDVPCRGQANAFAGTAGIARQIWVSQPDQTYLRVLDSNTRDLVIERRDGRPFVIVQYVGSYCMTADAAPCFLTLEFTENALIWADDAQQHPSMTARLDYEKAAQEETPND